MPGALDNGLHFSHDYVVRNAGLLGRHRPLDLGAEPCVIRSSILTGRELRLDGVCIRHVSPYQSAEHVKVTKGDLCNKHTTPRDPNCCPG